MTSTPLRQPHPNNNNSSSNNNTNHDPLLQQQQQDPLASRPSARLQVTSSFLDTRTDGIRASIEEAWHHEQEQQQQQVQEKNETKTSQQQQNDIDDDNIDSEEEEPLHSSACHGHDTVTTSPSTRFSFVGAVVNLCSATLGAGVLSLPHACAQAGLVTASLLLVGAAVSTVVSIQLLVRACTFYRLYTYESLTEVLYGRRLRTAVELCIVLFCQGCAVAYLIAVADILQQANLLVGQSRSLSMILVWTCVLLPLSLLRTMTSLQMSSAVGIASIGTLVFAAVIHLWDDEQQYHDQDDPSHNETVPNRTIWQFDASWPAPQDDGPWLLSEAHNHSTPHNHNNTHHSHQDVDWSSMLGPQHGILSILTACPIILFAFSCQVNVCAIYEELPMPALSSTSATTSTTTTTSTRHAAKEGLMRRVAVAAVAICAFLYAGISLASLADFGAKGVTPNILNAYQPLQGIMQVAAAGMVLAVTMAFPLNIFPARVTLEGIWQECVPGDCCGGCWKPRPRDTLESEPHASLTAALLEEEDLESSHHLELEDDPEQEGRIQEVVATPVALEPRNPEPLPAFPWFRHIVLTLLLAGSALGIALVAPNISIVFQIIGGTASSGLGFCVPGLLGLRLGRDLQDGSIRAMSWALLYGGAVIGVLTTAVTIYQIVTGS